MEALLQALADGQFHDLQELVTKLGVSTLDLEKQWNRLRHMGLEIERDPASGWRLPPNISLLDKQQILTNLPETLRNSIQKIDIHFDIDSTNAEAVRHVRSGFQGKALIVAERQECGRGRRGRHWNSPMARNLYMTVVWPVANDVQALAGLSLVIALSLVNALRNSKLLGMEKLRVKWPNDVWLYDGKLAGILTELERSANGGYQVIIGTGLNVDMPAEELTRLNKPVTDLTSQGNLCINRSTLLAEIVRQLDQDLNTFTQCGFSSFRDQWHRLDMYHNQNVEVHSGRNCTSGKVQGVNHSGALILETPEGQKLISGGELAPSLRAAK